MTTDLTGPYKILNDAHMRKRASQTDDPRHVFFIAGLTSRTYEEYLAKVGDLRVYPKTHPSGPITGRREIKWWRDQRWISDI